VADRGRAADGGRGARVLVVARLAHGPPATQRNGSMSRRG